MRNQSSSRPILQREVSRRNLLWGSLGVVGAAALGGSLAGCTGSPEQKSPLVSGTTPTPKPPSRGGTLVLPVGAQMSDLNPMYLAGGNAADFVSQYVYERLAHYNQKAGKYELSIAQSVEKPDPLTFIFKIRPTAKFQNLPPLNGRQVASQDIATFATAYAANPRAATKEFVNEYIDRYETPDAATLVVRLKKPNGWAMSAYGFCGNQYCAVAKELMEKEQYAKQAIGSGPYVLDEFDPNSTISGVRRPDGWHGREQPYIDKVIWRVITDEAARGAALKAKQIDGAGARDKVLADEFRGYGPDMVIERELAAAPVTFMRAGPGDVFQDERVRQAFYKAIDVQELIDTVDLGEGAWSGPVPPSFGSYALPLDEIKRSFPHDVKAAKDLLTAAGWDPNREVPLIYPNTAKSALLCEILQKQLAATGFKTKLVPQDTNTVWLPAIRDAKYELSAYWARNYADPNVAVSAHASLATVPRNKWSDKEIDDMIDRQLAEYDVDKQRQIILDGQRLILKKASPTIILYQTYTLSAHWQYYHLVNARGDVDRLGQYYWIDTSDPGYPRR